jgi:hypothetical protein
VVNANLHAGPLITLLIDFVLNNFSFPTSHFLIIAFVAVLYALINLVYSLTVAVIYKPINWVSWLSYVLLVGVFVMALVMHLLGRFVYNHCKKNS